MIDCAFQWGKALSSGERFDRDTMIDCAFQWGKALSSGEGFDRDSEFKRLHIDKT